MVKKKSKGKKVRKTGKVCINHSTGQQYVDYRSPLYGFPAPVLDWTPPALQNADVTSTA